MDTASREKFSIIFRGLLEKEFPAKLKEQFGLIENVPPPMKTYIFLIPTDSLVFDYKFLKEVSGHFYCLCIRMFKTFLSFREKGNGNSGLMTW